MMMGSSFTHRLKQLSDDDCWSLFRHIAFGHVQGDLEEFEKIGKKIAKKCKGVPLAARISAGLMRMKTTIREWKTVLASDIWEVKSELEKGFMPELLLSYYTLPSDMKQCFMYCAIFLKDEQIEKDELVKLWMAQGFLGSDGSKDLEIIGSSFFDNLAMRSFFQDFEKDDEGNIIGCKMHDLVHDFAQVLTKNESFILENGKEFGSIKLRHLSTSMFKSPSIYKERKLRTLRSINKWIDTIPLELFQQLTCLRALDLSGSGSDFEKLPVEVARLLHLRYLDLSRTCLDKLPETICNLLNLQTLKLKGCSDLSKLPEGIGKLSSLRHLELEGTDSLSYFPRRMGTLSSLRTLDKFIVGESEGCKIGELKDLNHLQGSLKISGLEQVTDLYEVVCAEIRMKKNLRSLALVFKDCQGDENTQEEYGKQMEGVLKGLQPHENLEELKINFYPGPKLPTWMSLLSNLIKLELYDCKKCSELPALGRLESLKVLKLNELQSLKRIGCEFYGIGTDSSGTGGDDLVKPVVIFPKLKKLEILDVVDLEEWDIPFQNDAVFFPNLSELRLCWCSRLRGLPALGKLKSLQALELMHLERVECLGPEFLGITSNEREELAPAVAFPELTYLHLYGMWRWDWKDQEELYSRQTIMPCLSKLKMFMCAMIKVVPHYMFSHTLRELEIRYCPQLTGMQPCLPPLLEKLFLGGDVGVLSKSFPISTFPRNNYPYLSSVLIISFMHSMLPQGFNQLTAIRNLHFDDCFYLDFTPEDLKHLTMLRELNICHCPVLKEHFDKGVDRSIISNTLEIVVDYIVVQAA